MKANELMIGDWVQNPLGWEAKVMSIKHTCVIKDEWEYLFKIGISKDTFQNNLSESDLSPIPLTPEILEKNGFELKEGEIGMYGVTTVPHYLCKGVPFEVFCDGDPFAIWFKEPVNIKYVHELQHALRLCGIDKTIEL